MQVIDCDCGRTLQAANEEELTGRVREHLAQDHPDQQLSDEEVRELVAQRSYAAMDS